MLTQILYFNAPEKFPHFSFQISVFLFSYKFKRIFSSVDFDPRGIAILLSAQNQWYLIFAKRFKL